jgi:hypothetical protein
MKSNTLPVDAPVGTGGDASDAFGTLTSKGGAGVVDRNENADDGAGAAAAGSGAGAAPAEFRKENPENADPPAALLPPSFSFFSGEPPFSSRPPNMTDNSSHRHEGCKSQQASQRPAVSLGGSVQPLTVDFDRQTELRRYGDTVTATLT